MWLSSWASVMSGVVGGQQAGELVLDAVGEVEPPFGGELEDDRGGEDLGHAAHPDARCGVGRLASAQVGRAVVALPGAGGAADPDDGGGGVGRGEPGDRRLQLALGDRGHPLGRVGPDDRQAAASVRQAGRADRRVIMG